MPELHFVRDREAAVPDIAGWRRRPRAQPVLDAEREGGPAGKNQTLREPRCIDGSKQTFRACRQRARPISMFFSIRPVASAAPRRKLERVKHRRSGCFHALEPVVVDALEQVVEGRAREHLRDDRLFVPLRRRASVNRGCRGRKRDSRSL